MESPPVAHRVVPGNRPVPDSRFGFLMFDLSYSQQKQYKVSRPGSLPFYCQPRLHGKSLEESKTRSTEEEDKAVPTKPTAQGLTVELMIQLC